jgi:hypothetical protein
MGVFGDFEMDVKKETEGVKIEYSTNADGSIPSVTILRASPVNKKYAKTLERLTRPYRRQIAAETLAPETSRSIHIRVIVASILLGWENVQDKDGKNIPFTEENAIKLFEKLPGWFDDIVTNANKESLFRLDVQETEAKN